MEEEEEEYQRTGTWTDRNFGDSESKSLWFEQQTCSRSGEEEFCNFARAQNFGICP